MTPLLWTVFAHSNAGDREAAASLAEALAARSDLPTWERSLVELQLAHTRGDREQAYRRARELAALSPDSEWLYLLATTAYDSRRYGEARTALERIDPDRGWIASFPSYWRLRIHVHHMLGDHDREMADARQLASRFPENRDAGHRELVALAAGGRGRELLERLKVVADAGDPSLTPWLDWVVQEALAHGHARLAARVLEAGLSHYAAPHPAGAERGWLAARARLLDVSGEFAAAEELWEELATRYPDSPVYPARLGILAARRGDRAEAERIDAWLDGLPTHTSDPGFELNGGKLVWRARIAAHLFERRRAVAHLREAVDRGLRHGPLLLHAAHDLAPLRGYPPFEALLRERN